MFICDIRRLIAMASMVVAPLSGYAADASDTQVTVQLPTNAPNGSYVVPSGKRFEILDVAFDCFLGSSSVTWRS